MASNSAAAMARLLLEDGTEYRGKLFGAVRSTAGEVGKGINGDLHEIPVS